jgi:hypothetical protein
MRVHELVARLEKADPDDIVLIDSDSQCLFLLNRRVGMFPLLDEQGTEATLTERDEEFLRIMRVRF